MIQYVIGTIGVVSLILGLISGFNYIMHPLAGTEFGNKYLIYTGKKFWVTAFICLLALYLKG